MNIGKMRQHITIQQQQIVKNSFGEDIDSWADVCTIWASVEPLLGKEFFAAEQIQSEVTTRIRIRYRKGFKPSMRVAFEGKIFSIISIIDYNSQHTELQLMCKDLWTEIGGSNG